MSHSKILRNKQKIVQLFNENIDLEYNLILKSFKSITEDERNIGTKNKPIIKKVKIGHWFSYHQDEDRPQDKKLKIARSSIIEVDGQKSDGWRILKYYTIQSL